MNYFRASLAISFLLIFAIKNVAFSQELMLLEKTQRRQIQDVEQPTLHTAPFIYYKPAVILLNLEDTTKEFVYWRRNFTDQFLECYSSTRIYPASKVFGFIQDSVYYRSTTYMDYHIFAPQIVSGSISLYYTREIQNLGEIRMIKRPEYNNNMIITGNVPRRYANNYTYFVTFPWDTLKMISVNRQTLPLFAKRYLRAYPEAYKESMKYFQQPLNRAATYTLIPIAAVGTAAFLLTKGNPTYFIAIGAGALVTYIAVKLFVKPKMFDPEAMSVIIEKCKTNGHNP